MFSGVLSFLAALLVSLPTTGSGEFLVSQNLGVEAYRASGIYQLFRPERAFDGEARDWRAYWNSGDIPPQWIEVDLQRTYNLVEIRLVVAQLPDGDTAHEVWVSNRPMGGDVSGGTLVCGFAGVTNDRDVLDHRLAHSVSARYVQIRTIRSPSWVAWMEVQVFAAPAS